MGFEQTTDEAQELVTDLRGRNGLPTEAQKLGEGIPEDVRAAVGIKCASVGASDDDDSVMKDK